VPLTGAANVFCDNQGVVNNTTSPESVLGEKHNQICYHRVREAAAAGIIWITKEGTDMNLADILTKPLGLPKRRFLLQAVLKAPGDTLFMLKFIHNVWGLIHYEASYRSW